MPDTRPARVALHEMMDRLLLASHHLPPDELLPLVEAEAARAGFRGTCLFVVDEQQRELQPLPGDGRTCATLSVDATIAGHAFRTEQAVEASTDDGEGRRLWLPLRNGVQRTGVMYLDAQAFDDELAQACVPLATLITELIISKTQYGDSLVLAQRREQMTLAAELRWALLPPLTFATDDITIACALEPAYSVAGDAFDYAMNGSLLHFAVFDAMGHGIEAARMSNLAIAGYRHGRRIGLDLAETYSLIGQSITDECGPDAFVTGHLMTLDAPTGNLEWVNAGHPLPLLLRQGRLVKSFSSTPSLPFGMATEADGVERVSLEPGDRLVLYTDGLVEARSADGEPFGLDRLANVITRAFSEQHSAAEAVRRLMHTVLDHLDGPPDDDAAIALVSWRRPGDT